MESIVVDRLRDATAGALAGTPVLFAYLYGSHANGLARPDSDVDVAVYLDATVSPAEYLDHRLELAARLGGTVRAEVEVIALNEAPLRLAGRVVRDGVVIYSRAEPTRVRFESKTLREFFDFQLRAAPMDEQFLRDIAAGNR